MQKSSWLYLSSLSAVALIAAYFATLGGAPQTLFVKFLGLNSFLFLCLSLLIGPLTALRPKTFAPLIEPRPAIGLTAFVFVVLHAVLALVFYFNSNIANALSFPPIAAGAAAALIILVLALTSNTFSIRLLGSWWKRIQQFNYAAFLLSFIHFILQSKALSAPFSLNYAQVILLALGVVTAIVQIIGFFIRRKKLSQTQVAG